MTSERGLVRSMRVPEWKPYGVRVEQPVSPHACFAPSLIVIGTTMGLRR
jgi:hypothetical protein